MVKHILLACMVFCSLHGYAVTVVEEQSDAPVGSMAAVIEEVGLSLEGTDAGGLNPKFRNTLDALLARGARSAQANLISVLQAREMPTATSAAESAPSVGENALSSQSLSLRSGSSSGERAPAPASIPVESTALIYMPSIEAGQMPMAFLMGALEAVGIAHLVTNYPMDVLPLPVIIVATDLILRHKLGFYRPLSDAVRTQVGQVAFRGLVCHPVPTLVFLSVVYVWLNNLLAAKYKA